MRASIIYFNDFSGNRYVRDGRSKINIAGLNDTSQVRRWKDFKKMKPIILIPRIHAHTPIHAVRWSRKICIIAAEDIIVSLYTTIERVERAKLGDGFYIISSFTFICIIMLLKISSRFIKAILESKIMQDVVSKKKIGHR